MSSRSRLLLKLIHTRYAIWDLHNYRQEKGNYGPNFGSVMEASTYQYKHCPERRKDLEDSIILDMPEDIKVPLILGRLFLSTAYAKIDVYKRKITLRVGDEKIIFKSVKPASSLIKKVYMLSLRERMELDLEARLMGETLVINRSLDPLIGDYIKLNDLNEPLELRRNQVNDLIPTIEEGEVIDAPMDDLVETRNDELDTRIDDYPRALMNVPIIVGTFSVIADFAVLEDRDAFRDKGMKQTALAISTTEAEYVSARKACQQALWMKQALIDYNVEYNRWSLDELAYGVPKDGPYPNHHPSPYDIISYIQNDREGQVTRIHHEEEIEVQDYQILTCEIVSTLKPLEEIMWENVFCLEGNRDHVISYGMLLTLLVKKRKTRKDRGTRRGRHSTSSSTFDQPSSSHLNYDDDDDGNDEGTSRASTPSPTRFVNSLTNDVPQVFQNPPNIDPDMEPFYTRQTKIINRQV
ncbi:hypothetical protein Tco_1318785 [Tanacetum coccineum]